MSEKLRTFLQSDASRADKLLALLAVLNRPSTLSDIRSLAGEHGLRIGAGWNLSSILERTRGLAIKTTAGWELTEDARQRAAGFGISLKTTVVTDALVNLRAQVEILKSPDTERFLAEAIECVEHGYHRAAVVMSWVATIHVLQEHVVANHLTAFNREALKRDAKWRVAKSIDDLGRMKESDFLEVLVAISVLGKNVKAELKGCLDRRNACGHPNSYDLKELTVAHHVEVLVTNVFSKFSA